MRVQGVVKGVAGACLQAGDLLRRLLKADRYTHGGIMKRGKKSKVMTIVASLGLAAASTLLSTSTAFGDGDGSPPPESLRLVVGDDGLVKAFEWDPPSDANGPLIYDVNYRFGNEESDAVFTWTTNTFISSSGGVGAFGRFVECTPSHHPADMWLINITYRTPTGPSSPSNVISMCFPLPS
jgi:hypothetical protein